MLVVGFNQPGLLGLDHWAWITGPGSLDSSRHETVGHRVTQVQSELLELFLRSLLAERSFRNCARRGGHPHCAAPARQPSESWLFQGHLKTQCRKENRRKEKKPNRAIPVFQPSVLRKEDKQHRALPICQRGFAAKTNETGEVSSRRNFSVAQRSRRKIVRSKVYCRPEANRSEPCPCRSIETKRI
jgi:hypothetical protein